MDGARKMIYGTERLFDAPARVQRDYLTSLGLDLGTKVRCYVEGDTELGALVSAVGDSGGIEFVNLRGQVLEKRGKGLASADSLLNDMKSHVFSVVLIDQDREDYVRVLRRAAKERAFFGEFYISRSDIEFANFNVDELVEVVYDTVTSTGVQLVDRNALSALIADSTSGRSLMKSLKNFPHIHLAKGEQWGAALMRYAVTQLSRMVANTRTNCDPSCRSLGYWFVLANPATCGLWNHQWLIRTLGDLFLGHEFEKPLNDGSFPAGKASPYWLAFAAMRRIRRIQQFWSVEVFECRGGSKDSGGQGWN